MPHLTFLELNKATDDAPVIGGSCVPQLRKLVLDSHYLDYVEVTEFLRALTQLTELFLDMWPWPRKHAPLLCLPPSLR